VPRTVGGNVEELKAVRPLLPRRTVCLRATLMPAQVGEDPGVWMLSATVYTVFAHIHTDHLLVFQPARLPIDQLWYRRGQASPVCRGGPTSENIARRVSHIRCKWPPGSTMEELRTGRPTTTHRIIGTRCAFRVSSSRGGHLRERVWLGPQQGTIPLASQGR